MKDRLQKLWTTLKAEKWLWLLCFVLGFLSWQGISQKIGLEIPVSKISVDVDVPESWAVWEKSVQHVNILFKGSREDIRYLNNEQLRVVIPITEPTAGNQLHIKLSEKHLKNPTGAKVVRFSPPDIFIKLDQENEQLLPVKAAINGSLPEGFEIDKIVCTPASVSVSGAQQVLAKMKNIHTKPIDLKDHQSSFKVTRAIALPQTGRMRVDPEYVSVDFILVQRNSTEEFENIPVRILCAAGMSRNMAITPQTVRITVKGQQQRIEQFRTADLFAYVDCTGLDENTGYDLPVSVDLPEGLQLIKTDPAVIHIDIAKPNQEFPL
jgi:YbbR domain-containing protein